MSPEIPQDAARCLLLAAIGHLTRPPFLFEVRHPSPNGEAWLKQWFPVDERERCGAYVEQMAKQVDVYVGVLPRSKATRGGDELGPARLLWADLDSPPAVTALGRGLVPPATFVIESGSVTDGVSNLHAYWALSGDLEPRHVERANRRLAAALGGDARCVNAGRIMRPPGTLNHKTTPARPVQCVGLEIGAVYAARDVVGHLPDPEPPRPAGVALPIALPESELDHIAPADYVHALTGVEPNAAGKLCCPLPGHEDRTPSFQVYPTPERGWTCFGCGRGGTIIDLAAHLWGIEPRGSSYWQIRERLDRELGQRVAA